MIAGRISRRTQGRRLEPCRALLIRERRQSGPFVDFHRVLWCPSLRLVTDMRSLTSRLIRGQKPVKRGMRHRVPSAQPVKARRAHRTQHSRFNLPHIVAIEQRDTCAERRPCGANENDHSANAPRRLPAVSVWSLCRGSSTLSGARQRTAASCHDRRVRRQSC
jgi:hypothetical protein